MDGKTEDLRDRLREDSYVVVEEVFDPMVDFLPLYEQWQLVLDGLVGTFMARGLLTSSFESLPFEQRLLAVTAASGQNIVPAFDISLPQSDIQLNTPLSANPAIFRLLTHDKLLDAVGSLIGDEITSNPTQHVRMKLPQQTMPDRTNGLTAGVPFHQDQGVLLPEADESNILTCWVAITDADESNGCLYVFPGTELKGLVDHCPADSAVMQGQLGIPSRLLPATGSVPLPMTAGSVLFFNSRLVHGSYDNYTTDNVRISLDLRYQPTGQPTGRPMFPSFVARSRRSPASVLCSAAEWKEMWEQARSRLAGDGSLRFNRWSRDAPVCA